MEKLSLRKQLGIVKQYLNGLSYDEIAGQTRVSKGTVANVVTDLKAGRILDAQEPSEQLELLREIAVDLQRLKVSPGQAVTGIAVLSHLQDMGVEPSDVDRWSLMCRQLTPGGTETQAFVNAALYMEELRRRTGMSAESLETKTRSLEKEVTRLQSLAKKLGDCEQQLKDLEKKRLSLTKEVSDLEKRCVPLRQEVTQKEKREAELSSRTQELEERVQGAEERLAATRKELKVLAEIGLSTDDLSGLVQRLAAISQRHGIDPRSLRDRLLRELENLGAGLGLESLVDTRQHELDVIEQDIARAQKERVSLNSALKQLRDQQSILHTAIAEEQTHLLGTMRAMAKIATDAVAGLKKDLGKGVDEAMVEVRKLRNETLELGKEFGQFNTIIEVNQWIQTLSSLMKWDINLNASDVRAVMFMVLHGFNNWLLKNESKLPLLYSLKTYLANTLQELEQWKTS